MKTRSSGLHLIAAAALAALFLGGCGDSPENNLATAQLAMQTGNPAKAIEFTDKVLKAQPDNVEAQILRIDAQLSMRRVDEARKSIDALLARDPQKVEYHDLMIKWTLVQLLDLLDKSDLSTNPTHQQAFADALAVGEQEAQWLSEQEGRLAHSYYIRARFRQHEMERVARELNPLRLDAAATAQDEQGRLIRQRIAELEGRLDQLFAETRSLLGEAIKIKPDYHLAHENLVDLLRAQAERLTGLTPAEERRFEAERREAWEAIWPMAQNLSEQKDLPPSMVGRLVMALVRMPASYHTPEETRQLAWKLQQAVGEAHRKDEDYLVATGRLYLLENQPQEAKTHLKQVPASNPEAQFLLGTAHNMLSEYPQAVAILKSLTAHRVYSQISDVWTLYGQAARGIGDESEARRAAGEALKLDPNNTRAIDLMLSVNQERLSEMGPMVEKRYKENPTKPDVIQLYMQYLQATGDTAGVKRLLDENVSRIQPLTDELLNVLVDGYFIAQDYPSAEVYARRLADRRRENLDAQLRLAQAMLMQSKDEEVKTLLFDLRERFPEADNVDQMLAGLYLDRGQLDRAVELLDSIVQADPTNHTAHLLYARALMGQALLDDALTQIQAVLQDRPQDTMANTLAAQVYDLKEQPEEAEKYISRINPDAIDETRYPLLVARAQLRQGQLGKAAEILTRALERGISDPMIHALLADIYEKQNKKPQAEFQLLALARRAPDSLAAYRMLARHYIKNNDLSRGHEQLRDLAAKGGNEGWSRIAQAQLYMAAQPPRFDDALTLLDSHHQTLIRSQNRQALRLADALAQLYLTRADVSGALAVYQRMIDVKFLDAQAKLRRVALLRAARQNDEALRELEELAVTIGKSEPELRYQVMRGFSELGDSDRSLRLLEDWIAAEPDQPTLYRWKAEELTRMGQLGAAHESIAKGLELAPDNPRLRQLMAGNHVSMFRFPEAEAALDEMAQLDRGSRIFALAAKGQMFLRLGLAEQANETFSELEKLGRPNDPRIILAMAQGLSDISRDEQAVFRLGQIPAYAQQYPSAQILWARIEQRSGQIEQARQRLLDLAAKREWVGPATQEIMRLDMNAAAEQTLAGWIDEAMTIDDLPAEQQRAWRLMRVRLSAAKRDWRTALGVVEELVRREPNIAQLQVGRFLLLVALGQYEQASQMLGENKELADSVYGPSLAVIVGEPYTPGDRQGLSAWIEAVAMGDLDRARSLIDTMPPLPTLFRADFEAMLNRSDAQSAEVKTAARYMLAAALALNADLPQLADEFLVSGLAKVPNAVPLYGLRLMVLTALRQPADAVMGNVKAAGPSTLRLLMDAETAQKAGDHAGAAQIAGQILELEPTNDHVRYYMSQQFQFAEQYDKAIETLRPLTNRPGTHRNNAENDWAYLVAEYQPQNIDEAYQLAQNAFMENPENPALRDTIGWLEFAKGHYDLARQHLSRAVALLPAIPDVHLHMAMTYKELGNEQWMRYHLRAASRGPDDNRATRKARDILAGL